MSSIIFESYKSLYNYYYQVGKNWISPNQAMPDKDYACLIKIQINNDEPECIKGRFTQHGWLDNRGNKIKENFRLTIIEWKYDPATQSQCEII